MGSGGSRGRGVSGVWGRGRRVLAMAAAAVLVAAGCGAADRALLTAPRCGDASARPSPTTFQPGQVYLMGSLVRSDVPPGPIPGWHDIVSVASATSTAAAVRADGTVSVVGVNYKGLLGAGPDAPDAITVPQPVPGITDAVSVHASGATFLVVRRDGTVAAWGDTFITDGGTRRGDGRAGKSQPTPMQVPQVEDIVDISGGSLNVLALRSDGRVTAWGINLVDSLGDPHGTVVRTLDGRPGALGVANADAAAVIVSGIGEVCAWGNNSQGLLGVEPTGGQTPSPVKVEGLERIVQVAGGGDHALALDADGDVWAWGRGASGSLGDGNAEQHSSATPTRVGGLPPITRVAVDGLTGFAIDTDGGLWTWGSFMPTGALLDSTRATPVRLSLPGAVQTVSGPLALLDGAAVERGIGSA